MDYYEEGQKAALAKLGMAKVLTKAKPALKMSPAAKKWEPIAGVDPEYGKTIERASVHPVTVTGHPKPKWEPIAGVDPEWG